MSLAAGAADEEEPSGRKIALRLFREHLRPRWKGLVAALACAALTAALTAELGALLNPLIKGGFVKKSLQALWVVTGLIAGIGVLRGLAQVAQSTLVNRIGHGMVGEMQVRLFGRLVRADLAQLRAQHSGAYVASILYDAGLIREAATQGVVNYTREGLTVLFALGYMAVYDPFLTLLVLVAGPLASGVMRRFAKRTRKAAAGAMNETSALSTAVMESLDGIKLVKIDDREAEEIGRVAAVVARRERHVVKGANARAIAPAVTETLSILVVAGVIFYAGWRATSDKLTVGQLASFLVLLMMAGQSLRQVSNLQAVFAEGLQAARRLFAALDVAPEVADRPDAPALLPGPATVRFEHVGFGYAPGTAALQDVTIEVRRGETVALVGPSGGGKSTILNLIPRFYDVTAGGVTVDGQDVREVTLSSLRGRIALVTQEPFLFDDTVRANIAHARPDATPAQVEAAARQAAAHDFVAALPKGYDTAVGEAGARLSGGQRQRIAIARAFLKDAPILLLDEATSALDTESEALVQAALERLTAGRTTLMIAHRLSTVRGADRIYVVDAGRIVEEGTHASLLARGGLYARLARAQNLDIDPLPRAGEGGTRREAVGG